MAGPPQKWHKHARGRERRKSSPLKTIALGDGSYFPDTSHIEYVEGIAPPEVETLPPRRPPKAAIRDFHLFSGGHGSSSLASHPYARLCAGTDRAGLGAPGAPPTTPAGHGLPTTVNPFNANQQIFLIPPAVSILTQGDWPIIYFGDDAPFPRVRFTLYPKDPQYEKDLSMDLIKRAPGKWVMPGVVPTGDVRLDPAHSRYNAGYKVPRAFDSTIGLGGLQWTLDAGDNPANWNGLTRDQLLEFMYRSLEEVLGDWVARDQLRKEISKGPLAKNVENVEDPLPPLPLPPKKGSFPHGQYGKHPLADAQTRFKNAHNFWGDYSRPSLAVQPGAKKDPNTLKLLPQRLFAHMREGIQKPDNIGDLHDTSSEDDNASPPGPGGGPGGGPGRPPRGSPRVSPNGAPKASEVSDLMKIDPPPVDPELGPDPVDIIEDGGRTARVDEHSGLPEKKPLGAPEALKTGEEAGSKSSSSGAFETATTSGEKRKRMGKQNASNKANRRSVGTAAHGTAASNRPVRNRKPPNWFGYTPQPRTTGHRSGSTTKRLNKVVEIIQKIPLATSTLAEGL